MRSKDEHISFWIEQSIDDWKAVDSLLHGKNYLQSLFFAHLVIEKLCKSLWIKFNIENIPPRSHNLIYILSFTPLHLPDEISEFLLSINRFQLEGRYPEYMNKMHLICNQDFTSEMIKKTNEVRLWLIGKLQ